MQSSFLEKDVGSNLSQPGRATKTWHRVQVPTMVLSALTKAGVYPDLRVGLNAYQIPDSSDEFNAKHDLAKFSHLPDKRNPWRDPWWFRREFTLPKLPADRRVWLHFDAINYRAEVWVNGKQVADRQEMAGMFQRFQFDITEHAKTGVNALAVKVYPVDHPGLPQKQVEVLGPERSFHTELERDVTEIVSVGYDCMMTVPDRNMGLWQNVWLDWTGPVDIRNPFVVTDLPLPETNRATLTVSAELVNATASPVKGILRGTFTGTDLRFEQPVELAAHETKVVTVDPKPVMHNPRLWWPVNYGEQYLYNLALSFETGRVASDREKVTFGVREIGYELLAIKGWHGRRVLVNGQRILCRGGYIQPELMFDWDARRMETDIGATYSWAEPEQYFYWVREARNWMFMMEGGSASLPPISSLSRFLPEVNQPTLRTGEEALPVLWSDNYFSLLPHESHELTATLVTQDLAGAKPILEVGGWNIESEVDCRALALSSKEIKAGRPLTVTADIAGTFLDGSRVFLKVDGLVKASLWAWARDGRQETLTFPLTFDRPGKHMVEVGGRKLELTVKP